MSTLLRSAPSTKSKKSTGVRGRPLLRTSYDQDLALANTSAKRRSVIGLVIASFVVPFMLTDDLLQVLTLGMISAVGAIGLNLVTGYAGQVSLGHAFFIGIGAYTGAVLGGDPDASVLGYGLPMWIWLPAAGVTAAIAGLLVGPLAVRLRGLYLAIVTLGLVFLGDHVFREARGITGGPGVGRRGAKLELFGIDFASMEPIEGLSRNQAQFFLALIFLIIFAVLGRNIARSGVGRAFGAVRDRDVAAAVIGVFEPGAFSLLLSIQYIAMILIGGVATISGAIMGAMFIALLPRLSQFIAHYVPAGLLTVFQLEAILYGVLIIGFLIFEPRGLFGIWIRIRNYWKGWPFSY